MKKFLNLRLIIGIIAFLLETTLLIGLLCLVFLFPYSSLYSLIAIIVIYLANTSILVFIANNKQVVDFKISWLLVVSIFPPFGAFLYILFAQKLTTKKKLKYRYNPTTKALINGLGKETPCFNKFEKEENEFYSISKYLYNQAKADLYMNTQVTYYKIGEAGFPVIIEELKRAEKFIFLEFFIIKPGELFDQIYEILKNKAKEGLDIRLIYDDVGSVSYVEKDFDKKAIKDGIKCFAFNKIRPSMDVRQNCRDHRKIIIIDGVTGFTGGFNLADEYANIEKRFGKWKDNIVRFKGEAVSGLTSVFLSSWSLKDFKKEEDFLPFSFCMNKKEEYLSNGYIQPYGVVPFSGEYVARNVFLKAIYSAKKSIYISTPYFIPDEEILTALTLASNSGIDVRIILPGIPDKKLIYSVSRGYYSILLANGIKVYEYTPGFNHQKSIIIDGNLAITGTINFDYRSLFLHFENGIVFYDSSVVMEMKLDLEEMIAESKLQDKQKYLNQPLYLKIWLAILRIVAPLF